MNKKGQIGFIAVILAILIIIVSLIFAFFYFVIYIGWAPEYSYGERTGDIYKFSKKGLIYKSWEGVMYLGGMASNGGGSLQMEKFYFSIPESQEKEKQEIINSILECSRNRNKKCTIKYQQWLKWPIYQSSSYTVTGVSS